MTLTVLFSVFNGGFEQEDNIWLEWLDSPSLFFWNPSRSWCCICGSGLVWTQWILVKGTPASILVNLFSSEEDITEDFFPRCLTDYSTSGGPIIALFYSIFPVVVSAIITVCYIGVWITIQVTKNHKLEVKAGISCLPSVQTFVKVRKVSCLLSTLQYFQCLWILSNASVKVYVELVSVGCFGSYFAELVCMVPTTRFIWIFRFKHDGWIVSMRVKRQRKSDGNIRKLLKFWHCLLFLTWRSGCRGLFTVFGHL